MAAGTGIQASSSAKTEGILGIALIIGIAGFFILLIFQGIDNLFTDILDDLGNFPGLKQLLNLLGTVANAFTSLFSWIGGGMKSSSSGS